MYSDTVIASLSENPYCLFVSFLYAWVAANIAERFSQPLSKWAELQRTMPKRWYIPIWSHLTLAAFVVGTSWLGWTGKFLGHEIAPPKVVIGPSSLLLIVDFWILGTYFAFVAVVYEVRLQSRHDTAVRPYSTEPAYWLTLIFAGYVLWDVLAYSILPRWTGVGDGTHFWGHSWMSLFCCAVAYVLLRVLRGVRLNAPFWILGGDGAVLALVLFYRALKQSATPSLRSDGQTASLLCDPLGSWLNVFTWICLLTCLGLAVWVGVSSPRSMKA